MASKLASGKAAASCRTPEPPALENKLQRHLHDSGISRAGDKAEGAEGRRARIEKPIRIVELSVIESVEEFSTVLERLGLPDNAERRWAEICSRARAAEGAAPAT
jgi:hypothetical protein